MVSDYGVTINLWSILTFLLVCVGISIGVVVVLRAGIGSAAPKATPTERVSREEMRQIFGAKERPRR